MSRRGDRVQADAAIALSRGSGGVCHVHAETEADLLRGLGYCHGRDRALQMLLSRTVVEGRGSELLEASEEMLVFDRFFRRLNLGGDVAAEAGKLQPRERQLAEAYCDGVNQALARRMPWELRLLRYRHRPWTIEDTFVISRAMGYPQVAQHQADMERFIVELVQAGVPRRHLASLFPGQLDDLDEELLAGVRLGERVVPGAEWPAGILAPAGGSNNWVIAPRRTASGRAILAGDPHLEANRLPAVWYEIVLELGERFCIAGTIPGLPFAAIGRTNDLAWSPTYGCLDAVDSWVEDCRDGGYRRVVDGETRWEPFQVRTETIGRKKGADVTVRYYENQHGVLDGDPFEAGRYLATRWSGASGTGARSLGAAFGMLHARDAASAMELLGSIETAWHWVIADSAGDIGYQMSGCLPIRRDGWDGLLPVAGWDPANDWQGIAPATELPRVRNPAEGFIATANQDMNRFGKRRATNLPMGPDRARRIGDVLAARDDWTAAEVRRMQMDTYSIQARRFLDVLSPLLGSSANETILAEWDCRYEPDSLGADLFERFYLALVRQVFAPVLGERAMEIVLGETAIFVGFYANFDAALLDPDSPWFGDSPREQVFRAAAARALEAPPRRWGDRNRFVMKHLMFGDRLPRRLGFDHGPVVLRGGRATIHQGQIFRMGGRETNWAPSIRMVTDLGEPVAWTALAGGPSDRRFSRLYVSEVDDWSAGRFKALSPGVDATAS